MINYHKNELINECLRTYYSTFAQTLDTADFVPPAYNKRILRYIFRNMRKQFRLIDKEDKAFQRNLLKNPPVADEGQQSESSNVVNELSQQTVPTNVVNELSQQTVPTNVVNELSQQPESETVEYEPAELDNIDNLLNKY